MKRGLKNLLKLADVLDGADKEHRANGEPEYDQTRTVHSCGTPACAIGHWAVYRGRRNGWGIEGAGYGLNVVHKEHRYDFLTAAQDDFGISFEEAVELFEATGCGRAKTAKQAAKYIRRFVARKVKEAGK